MDDIIGRDVDANAKLVLRLPRAHSGSEAVEAPKLPSPPDLRSPLSDRSLGGHTRRSLEEVESTDVTRRKVAPELPHLEESTIPMLVRHTLEGHSGKKPGHSRRGHRATIDAEAATPVAVTGWIVWCY